MVLFVFREEYYVKNMEPRDELDPKYEEWKMQMDKVKGTADVIIAKQRHGADRHGEARLPIRIHTLL